MKTVFSVLITLQLLIKSALSFTFTLPRLGNSEPFCFQPFVYPVDLTVSLTPTKASFLKSNWYEIARHPTELGSRFTCGQLIFYEMNLDYQSPVKFLYLLDNKTFVLDSTFAIRNVDQTKYSLDFLKRDLNFWILEFDPDYNWIVFGEPCLKTAWIYSVTPTLDSGILNARFANLRAKGFNIANMINRTNQICPDVLPNANLIPGNNVSASALDVNVIAAQKRAQRVLDLVYLASVDQIKNDRKIAKSNEDNRLRQVASSTGTPFISATNPSSPSTLTLTEVVPENVPETAVETARNASLAADDLARNNSAIQQAAAIAAFSVVQANRIAGQAQVLADIATFPNLTQARANLLVEFNAAVANMTVK